MSKIFIPEKKPDRRIVFLVRIRNLFPQRIERQSMKMETQEAISHIFAFFYNAIGVPVARRCFLSTAWPSVKSDDCGGRYDGQLGIGDDQCAPIAIHHSLTSKDPILVLFQ